MNDAEVWTEGVVFDKYSTAAAALRDSGNWTDEEGERLRDEATWDWIAEHRNKYPPIVELLAILIVSFQPLTEAERTRVNEIAQQLVDEGRTVL